MANEIPTLVSQAAGLQEIVGENEQGVRLYQDPAAWQAAVEGLLAQPARLRANGECGLEIAACWLTEEPIRTAGCPLARIACTFDTPCGRNETYCFGWRYSSGNCLCHD